MGLEGELAEVPAARRVQKMGGFQMKKYLSAALLIACIAAALFGNVTAGAVGPVTVSYEGAFGTLGLGQGQFSYPADVAVDKWGNVYVAGGGDNGDHRVQMFDADGEFIRSVGTTVTGSAELSGPRSLTTDRWGNIFVAETGNGGRIHRYHPELLGSASTWHGTSITSGEYIVQPTGIGIAPDGTAYTVSSTSWVQRWDSNGTFYNSWYTGAGTAAFGVAPSADGDVYVANDLLAASPHSIQVFTPWGSFLREWGGLGTDPGQLNRPYDVGVDGGDAVFVLESQGRRAQVFTPEGTPLAIFGDTGTNAEGRMSFPYGLGVGGDRTVYVADTFNQRISKWHVTHPARTVEIAGGTRYATAAAASQKAFPAGSESEYAVVTTGKNWPDALGGAPLAGALKAPLLLTDPDVLSPEVTAEIARLNVQEIYVLGGTKAVSGDVYASLAALVGPGDIKRLAGDDRYATANRIAEEVVTVRGAHYDGTAIVVTGKNFPDALAVSPIAAANGWPIFLTEPEALPASVNTAMQSVGANHGYIIGGVGAVSPDIETLLATPPFMGFTRIGEGNRYATAAAVAELGFDGLGMLWSRPAIATGANFPDALAGGVLQGSDYSVMLLTPKDYLHPDAAAALSANADKIYELRYLGGAGVVGPAARASAAALLP